MVTFLSPRIHNLGDFIHCLPVISGYYKTYNIPIQFIISNRLRRFNGIKNLLLHQEMFSGVFFTDEMDKINEYDMGRFLLDDTGSDRGNLGESLVVTRYYNHLKTQRLDFDLDRDFQLKTISYDDEHSDKILVGDRWSSKDAPDVDERRYSNHLQSSGILGVYDTYYLDYKQDLMYNLSLIQGNPNPFVTTFTGIGILADLMKKDTYILWDEDVRNWNNKPVEMSFKEHYFQTRNSKLTYIKDFKL